MAIDSIKFNSIAIGSGFSKNPAQISSAKPASLERSPKYDTFTPTKPEKSEEYKIAQKYASEILENNDFDSYEEDEINEDMLRDMFLELQKSTKNNNPKSLNAIKAIFESLAQEDDYVDFNSIIKAIKGFCNRLNYGDELRGYRFASFLNSYDYGILADHDEEDLREFYRIANIALFGCDEDTIYDILPKLSSAADESPDGLKKLNARLLGFCIKYKGDDLADALKEYYVKSTPLDEITSRLDSLQNSREIISRLEEMGESFSSEQLIKVFGTTIDELLNRGYDFDQIAQMLSEGRVSLMGEALCEGQNPVILADFIENNIESLQDYLIFRDYTSDQERFNDVTLDATGQTIYGKKYMASEVNTLSAVLRNEALARDMIVYRGEGFSVLNQLLLSDEEPLGSAIKKAIEKEDYERLEEICEELVGAKITQPRFLSTSFSKGTAKGFVKHDNGILWEIEAPKGSNGLFIDPFNIENSNEREILFNKNSSLIIYDAHLGEDGIFVISARLERPIKQTN